MPMQDGLYTQSQAPEKSAWRLLETMHRYRGRVALCCGGVAALIGLLYFAGREAAIRAQGRAVPVLIASVDLPAGVALMAAHLRTIEIPHQFIPAGVLTRVDDALGFVTLTALRAGEPVTDTRIAPATQAAQVAAVVPPGRRAVSVPYQAARAAGGLLRPRDRVDLLVSFDFGARDAAETSVFTVLRNLEVLAVNREIGGTAVVREASAGGTGGIAVRRDAASEGTVTLAATPEEAQRVVFAVENGVVHLALRGKSEGEDPAPILAPATAANVTGLSSFIRRREYRGR